ncbi:MAG: glycine zipper 2TM domain-containing protein [Pseudomonadota bacterium]
MIRLRLSLRLAAVFLLPVALLACGPANQNSTVSTYAVGTQGSVRYGTVVGMRPVQVAGTRSGVGTAAGAVSGGLIGGTIGGDWRARTVGGVAGALLGGVAGTVVEEGVTSGQAVEFIIRSDDGAPDQAVIQTNEQGLRVGERVALSYTDRVRIARAVNAPPVVYSPTGK